MATLVAILGKVVPLAAVSTGSAGWIPKQLPRFTAGPGFALDQRTLSDLQLPQPTLSSSLGNGAPSAVSTGSCMALTADYAATLTENPGRWLGLMLALTGVFNLLDAMLTVTLVQLGLAEEANPLMASALEAGPSVFLMAKMTMVLVGLGVLWRFRTHRLAANGIRVTFGAYALLMVYHLEGIRRIVHLL